jgi:hypothetical protein
MSPRASVRQGPRPPVLGHPPVDPARDLTLILPAWAASALARNIADPGRASPKPSAVRSQQDPPSTPPPKLPLLYWRPAAGAAVVAVGAVLTLMATIRSPGQADAGRDRRAPLPGELEADPACGVYETYGTRVEFVPTPGQAGRLARRSGKLLFVLHVSGNFEDSCFT